MTKNLIISLLVSLLLTANSFSAGSSDTGSSKTKTQYDMAVSHIKAAKKFEEKNKIEKQKKDIKRLKNYYFNLIKNFQIKWIL